MKPEKEEKKDREMCEKRKEKMIIEFTLLVINEFTPEQIPPEKSGGYFCVLVHQLIFLA